MFRATVKFRDRLWTNRSHADAMDAMLTELSEGDVQKRIKLMDAIDGDVEPIDFGFVDTEKNPGVFVDDIYDIPLSTRKHWYVTNPLAELVNSQYEGNSA